MADPMQTTSGISDDTKTIITVLLLIFLFPVGLILMWFWTKWKTWVKLLISVPLLLVLLVFVGLVMAGFLVTFNPRQAIKKAQCAAKCGGVQNLDIVCQDACLEKTSGASLDITTGTLGKYPQAVKTSFIESCAQNSGMQKYCECSFQYIEKNLSLEDFVSGSQDPNSGNFGKVVQEAITSCMATAK